MVATITAGELNQLINCYSVSLIDVMLPEDFACRHIPGAVNACVYEMVFLDNVAACVPDKNSPIVVYDASGTTLAAKTARDKLERVGYHEVAILEGGLQGWQAAGFALQEAAPVQEVGVLRDGTYLVDTEKSVLEWTGRNINNRHYGRISISAGEIIMAQGRPLSGRFVLDMNTISDLDLQDQEWRHMLLRHLKSDDFFDVERYPTASFELCGSTARADAAPGTPNMEIAGSLTVKGVARQICFPAIIAAQEDGSIKAQAVLDLDRTSWNVCYGSGKLYERLGMHLVNDLISIELFIVAR